MKLTIEKNVFEKYPSLKIAFILASHIDNQSKLKESKHLLKEAGEAIQQTFRPDTVKTHDLISPWKVAQQEFGKKAVHYHTSVERLLHLVLKKKNVLTENVLTNVLYYEALKKIVPVGADDCSKLRGNLTFALSSGKEKIGWLKKLEKGFLSYRDEENILGTKLDYWKNKRTAVDEKSVSALVHLEALPPLDEQKLKQIARETAELIKTFCGGTVKVVILSKKKSSAII